MSAEDQTSNLIGGEHSNGPVIDPRFLRYLGGASYQNPKSVAAPVPPQPYSPPDYEAYPMHTNYFEGTASLLRYEMNVHGAELIQEPLAEFEPVNAAPPPSTDYQANLINSSSGRVAESLVVLASACALETAFVPLEGKQIAHAGSFRLTAIGTTYDWGSLISGAFTRPHDMTVHCYGAGPYLDTRQAIGLVYKDMLIAVAGAGLYNSEYIFIKQLQDVTGIHKSQGRDFYKTGLHNGFLWRDTMVRVWEQVAAAIGAKGVIIQSNKNNSWPKVRNGGPQTYDDVAIRLGYQPTDDGNRRKLLEQQPAPASAQEQV